MKSTTQDTPMADRADETEVPSPTPQTSPGNSNVRALAVQIEARGAYLVDYYTRHLNPRDKDFLFEAIMRSRAIINTGTYSTTDVEVLCALAAPLAALERRVNSRLQRWMTGKKPRPA